MVASCRLHLGIPSRSTPISAHPLRKLRGGQTYALRLLSPLPPEKTCERSRNDNLRDKHRGRAPRRELTKHRRRNRREYRVLSAHARSVRPCATVYFAIG